MRLLADHVPDLEASLSAQHKNGRQLDVTRFEGLSLCRPHPAHLLPFATTTASAIAVSLGEIAHRILRRIPVGEELIHLPNGRYLIDRGVGAGRTSALCKDQDQTQAGCASHGIPCDGLART